MNGYPNCKNNPLPRFVRGSFNLSTSNQSHAENEFFSDATHPSPHPSNSPIEFATFPSRGRLKIDLLAKQAPEKVECLWHHSFMAQLTSSLLLEEKVAGFCLTDEVTPFRDSRVSSAIVLYRFFIFNKKRYAKSIAIFLFCGIIYNVELWLF